MHERYNAEQHERTNGTGDDVLSQSWLDIKSCLHMFLFFVVEVFSFCLDFVGCGRQLGQP